MEKMVSFIRIYKSLLLLIIALILGASLGGCSEGVGDPCLPEVEKKTFSANDIYIEASSVQCETRVCGVFRYEGNPKEAMKDPNEVSRVERHVFCTCRCRAPSGGYATCSCPDGFECTKEDLLQNASKGLAGGYCVRKNLMEEKGQYQ